MLTTGLRASEVCGLDLTNRGTERGYTYLCVTRKGGREQKITLQPDVVEILDEHLAGRSTGPVFATRAGKAWHRSHLDRLVRRWATAASIHGTVSAHSLRHAFVTLSLDAGATLRDVQDAAGHADPRTTRRYDRARGMHERHPGAAILANLTGPRST